MDYLINLPLELIVCLSRTGSVMPCIDAPSPWPSCQPIFSMIFMPNCMPAFSRGKTKIVISVYFMSDYTSKKYKCKVEIGRNTEYRLV